MTTKNKYRIGGKVVCRHAASTAYRAGDTYDVVRHPITGGPAIRARDGLLDIPSNIISTFESISSDAGQCAVYEFDTSRAVVSQFENGRD